MVIKVISNIVKDILKKTEDNSFLGRILLVIVGIIMFISYIVWGILKFIFQVLHMFTLFFIILLETILLLPYFVIWLFSGFKSFYKLTGLFFKKTNMEPYFVD